MTREQAIDLVFADARRQLLATSPDSPLWTSPFESLGKLYVESCANALVEGATPKAAMAMLVACTLLFARAQLDERGSEGAA